MVDTSSRVWAGTGFALPAEGVELPVEHAGRQLGRLVLEPNPGVAIDIEERTVVEVLVRHPGKLVSQRQLLQEVWGPQYERETNYLGVFMAQVRRKLEPDPARPRYFLTEPGMGYRFEGESSRSEP